MDPALAESSSYPHDVSREFTASSPLRVSRTAHQAVHAVLCIARSGDANPVRVDELARMMGCPRNYLSKTLYQLSLAGVLRSERGPRGGFRLAARPQHLTLARVISPFEPRGALRCILGRAVCSDARPCRAHRKWKELESDVDDFLRTTTIANLLAPDPHAGLKVSALMKPLRTPKPRSSHGSAA